MTAYRQRALVIALFLQTNGPTKASQVAAAIGDPKARDILYRDVYGWFDRPLKGIYALSPQGAQDVQLWAGRSTPVSDQLRENVQAVATTAIPGRDG